MCGIMGFSFKKNTIKEGSRAILAHSLALSNDDRGGDSWGVLGIRDGKVDTSRGMGDLADCAYELLEYDTLFAHTRFATHGDKTVNNAHPFEIGDIIGAHNGVINNHSELNQKYDRKFEVDSMHLFAHLDSNLAFDDIKGYGAIEWINKKDTSRVYLSRLSGGSLSVYGVGTDQATKGIVWTSDEDHMILALEVAGIKDYFEYEIKDEFIYYVENGELFVTSDVLELGSYAGYQSRWEDYYDMQNYTTEDALIKEYGMEDEKEETKEKDMTEIDFHRMTDSDFQEYSKEWDDYLANRHKSESRYSG